MTKGWTEDNTKKAAEMWANGATMLQIAHMVGVSRSAVSGKISRNRDLFPEKGVAQARAEKIIRPLEIKKGEGQKPSSAMRFVLGAPKTVKFNEPKLDEYEKARLPGVSLVENKGCMYPLTESAPHRFCGCNRVDSKRYCEYHAEKCSGGIAGESRWYKKLVKGVE